MKNPMRLAAALLCTAACLSSARSEQLSPADREALLENLEKIRDDANSRVDARFRTAIAAYREAMATEESAYEFYLKCIEKVNFEDQQRKAADFREWKKKEEDRLKEPGFRLALRYQLRWLVLTLRAASEKTKLSEITPEAQDVVDAIFQDAPKLGPQIETLGQPVTSTVFARAYEINGVKSERWPQSPINLDQFYGQVIFPSLRVPGKTDALRSAWIRRIQQESIRVEAMDGEGGGGRRPGQPIGPRGQSVDKFNEETLPDLQWQMEMDLFKAGDEKGAAMRMMAHIQKNLTHRSARQWGEDLKNLLRPKEILKDGETPAPVVDGGGA